MSDDKSKVFQEGDVIRLITKPEKTSKVELRAEDFAEAMELARKRAAENRAREATSALSAYEHHMLLSAVTNIESQCEKLRERLAQSTIRKAPWYTKIMFWRKF